MSGAFTEALAAGVLLCDGAMGTLAQASGVRAEGPGAELCLIAPELVAALHRRYLDAGADVVETHTYGASRLRLARFGLAGRTQEINREGAAVAVATRDERAPEGRPVWVAGSVSPATPPRARPGESADRHERDAAVREQVAALAEGGVDVVLLETFTAGDDLAAAVRAARQVTDLPIVAQATFLDDDHGPVTAAGETPAAVLEQLDRVADLGLAAVGTNCTLGPQGLLAVLRGMRGHTEQFLAAQPNAGLPHVVSDRGVRYAADVEHFARYVGHYVAAGARLVGGCCGTTPAHTAAARAVLDAPERTEATGGAGSGAVPGRDGPVPSLAPGPARRHALENRVDAGRAPRVGTADTTRAATSAAFSVPAGREPAGAVASAGTRGAVRRWVGAGSARRAFLVGVDVGGTGPVADGVALARSAAAGGAQVLWVGRPRTRRAPVSPTALALSVSAEVDLDIAVTVTSWDTSRLGLQADLLGLEALGLRTVICETGNPPVHADQPQRDGTWEVDTLGLLRLGDGLNRGVDGDGLDLPAMTDLILGARFTPGAADLEDEARRTVAKIEAGARFLVSRPVYELERLRALVEVIRGHSDVPVVATLAPPRDFAHAEHLRHEVPDVVVPEAVLDRMRDAGHEIGGSEATGPAVAFAEQLTTAAAGLVDGVVLRWSGTDVRAVVARLRMAVRSGAAPAGR